MSEHTVERVTPGTESWQKYGAEHLQRYEFFAGEYAGKKVLDAACGTGYGTHLIAATASSALGLDVSEEAIGFCASHYQAGNLVYRHFDLTELARLGEKFDLVVSFETIEHLAEPAKFIADVAGCLNKGGRFICSTPNKMRHSDMGSHNRFHLHELSWEDFRRAFESHFVIDGCYHQSETVEYHRYMELRHLLHQEHARNNAFLIHRLELWLRRLVGRPFRPMSFYRHQLDQVQPHEVRIERMITPESWQKTFIISGTLKG